MACSISPSYQRYLTYPLLFSDLTSCLRRVLICFPQVNLLDLKNPQVQLFRLHKAYFGRLQVIVEPSCEALGYLYDGSAI